MRIFLFMILSIAFLSGCASTQVETTKHTHDRRSAADKFIDPQT